MISYDANGVQTEAAFGSPVTWTHVCTGSDRLLMVWIATSNSNSPVVTGVTYNGVAMTAMASSPINTRLYGFYLIAAATGSHTVSATLSPGSQYLAAASVSYTGVHQVSPFGTAATADHAAAGGASTTDQVAVTSAVGELAFFAAAHLFFDTFFSYQATTTATASNLTERAQIRNAQASGNAQRVMVGDQTGAASVTAGWSLSKDVFWDCYAVSLKPATSTSAAVSGTGGSGVSGEQVRTDGTKTLITTLTGDTFSSTNTAAKQAIIDSWVAATSPTWGWNAVRAQIPTSAVVFTGNTVATLTIPALADFQSDADQVLTQTVPSTILTGGGAIVAAPTVTITKTVTDLTPVDDYTMDGTATRVRP